MTHATAPPPPVSSVVNSSGVLPVFDRSKSTDRRVVGFASAYWLAKSPLVAPVQPGSGPDATRHRTARAQAGMIRHTMHLHDQGDQPCGARAASGGFGCPPP